MSPDSFSIVRFTRQSLRNTPDPLNDVGLKICSAPGDGKTGHYERPELDWALAIASEQLQKLDLGTAKKHIRRIPWSGELVHSQDRPPPLPPWRHSTSAYPLYQRDNPPPNDVDLSISTGGDGKDPKKLPDIKIHITIAPIQTSPNRIAHLCQRTLGSSLLWIIRPVISRCVIPLHLLEDPVTKQCLDALAVQYPTLRRIVVRTNSAADQFPVLRQNTRNRQPRDQLSHMLGHPRSRL
ncbi:uncharacterized protein EI90DRAFT_3119165 [Cantharellus anzutake]|uniref:uncharacterized protein n=1 Tax=Cantharellus anzutake TaxID=1750568 RepID=UPI0019044679|nr:uncharacterized protein EI90DRAFT_3119165 [Cantharellus anzutake]KAF8336832.1 hypothetical protein EI90DRAFT_3119165 [Cantharellus anzutake]